MLVPRGLKIRPGHTGLFLTCPKMLHAWPERERTALFQTGEQRDVCRRRVLADLPCARILRHKTAVLFRHTSFALSPSG